MAIQWIGSGRVEFDAGKVVAGAKAYFYDAGTSTPRVVYQDNALSTRHPQPVPADGSGRFPAVYLPGGLAKVRVTTAGGVILYEHDNVDGTAPTAGGGGSGTTDPVLLLSTGDVIWRPQTGVRAGFVRGNARTIGSATSGATERANADTQALFEYLWNNLSDAACPVVGGRGASSASDWAANKQLTLPDWRGRSLFGLDDMGNAAAGRFPAAVPFTTGNGSTPGSIGGEATHALTAAENGPHLHTGTTDSAGAHFHTYDAGSSTGLNGTGSGARFGNSPTSTSTDGAHVHPFTTASSGSGTGHNNVPPAVVGTYYIKL